MSKTKVYIDMDGTLARFHDADKMFIEAMWTPGFYVNLKPFEKFVEAVRLFIERNPDVDVYLLSAVLDTDPPFVVDEKNEWLDKYLPVIDKEHRIFTRAGEDKSNYINMDDGDCYLIDDYNKNLYEFEKAGGNSIKFHNDVNHRGLGEFGGTKGRLWEGEIIHYYDEPNVTCMRLEGMVGKIKDFDEFVIQDNALVEYIGNDEVVTVPAGIEIIDINAFWGKETLRKVELPDTVQIINPGAFSGCGNLREIALPQNLKVLDKNAFMGCSQLGKVDVPASVLHFNNQAFDFCESLKDINVDKNNPCYFSVDGLVYRKGKDEELRPDLLRCPCGKTGEVVLDNRIDGIAPEAFMNCTSITGVKFPEELYALGNGAFYNCTSLESVEIPASTVQIFDSVFAECSNLKRVVMPDNLRILGDGIFDGCKNLSELVISDEALVDYCERFNFLDQVFMTPCYNEVKERYEALKEKSIDGLINNANERSGAVNSKDRVVERELE